MCMKSIPQLTPMEPSSLSERICSKTSDLDVTVYPASQLGSESELLETARGR